MSYFTIDKSGQEHKYQKKNDAVKKAQKIYESGYEQVGVGKYKWVDGKLKYNFLPLQFYV